MNKLIPLLEIMYFPAITLFLTMLMAYAGWFN